MKTKFNKLMIAVLGIAFILTAASCEKDETVVPFNEFDSSKIESKKKKEEPKYDGPGWDIAENREW